MSRAAGGGMLLANSLSQASILGINASMAAVCCCFSFSFSARCFASRGGSLLMRLDSEDAAPRLLD